MQTLVLEEPGRLVIAERDAPSTPGPGEAQVRVHRVGVCGTDLHAYRGKQPFFEYPRVLGHELGVTVEAVGAGVTHVAPGDRCAVEPYLNCGKCIACLRGRPNCCAQMRVLGVHVDGGLRPVFNLPAVKLHKSHTLELDQLALVETLGIGAHAVARCQVQPDDTVLVIGAGPIGLGAIQFARDAGARVAVMDLSPSRLAFCREQLGVDHTITPEDEPPFEFTAVLDATGNPASMHAAFDRVAPSGRLCFIGLFPGDVAFHDPEFHRKELTLLASRNSTPDDFARVIAAMESGQIDTKPWITHRCTFGALPTTFETFLDPTSGVIKAVVDIPADGHE